MTGQVNCLLDVSASMGLYGKTRTAIALLRAMRQAAKAEWPFFPWPGARIRAWTWGDEIAPLKGSPAPSGRASLECLRGWLEELEEKGPVLIISDGRVGDFSSRNKFAEWLKSQSGLNAGALGIGPDCDCAALGRFSTSGKAYAAHDIGALLASMSEAPMAMDTRIESKLEKLADIDDEDD